MFSVLFDATTYHFTVPSFGVGIEPAATVETAKERHKREQFEICDAVIEGRAVRIPTHSPHYKSFVAMMNAPAKPSVARGFYDRATGGYIPSAAEDTDYLAMQLWEDEDAARARRTIREIMDRTSNREYSLDELAGI